jgi:AAA+ ATPase superfamily predicted ATPase
MNPDLGTLPFVGRKQELGALRQAYDGSGSAFWPIYGRRRVGKSELILQFGKNRPMLYLLGKRAPPEQMRREFLETAALSLGEPLLATMPVDSWKKVIGTVVERWKREDRLILVFDEFQWLVEKSPELPSVLQELWDRTWSRSGRIFLILCGSYIGFMEKEVLGKKSPLYGRRTGQILLKPFGYRDAAKFHPHASVQQKAATYFICGGIPLYLRYFSSERSVLQNIEQAVLGEQAALYREPDFLLREELREVEKYYMILMALAGGALPSRDIARRSGIGDRSLHYYVDQLASLGYIGRHFPLTSRRPKRHEVRYRLLDPFLRFWFHFVYPHTSHSAQLGARRAATQLVQPGLDAYFGLCFESLCREALPVLYERENVSALYEVGSYWDTDVQIDVVGLRRDGWTDLGECKWGRVKSIAAVAAEIDQKAACYPNDRGATICQRLFVQSPAKSTKAPANPLRIHTLEELYDSGEA